MRRDEVEDGALLAMIAGRVLAEAPKDTAPTGERYRIVLEHCPDCGTTAMHNVVPRHLDGSHTIGNLVTPCTAHHRVVHDGPLTIEHEAGDVRFRRAGSWPR